MATLEEYDTMVYPGFLRRGISRWNEDGSCAPMARVRGPKGDAFVLALKPAEIEDDINHIDSQVGWLFHVFNPATNHREKISRARIAHPLSLHRVRVQQIGNGKGGGGKVVRKKASAHATHAHPADAHQ